MVLSVGEVAKLIRLYEEGKIVQLVEGQKEPVSTKGEDDTRISDWQKGMRLTKPIAL